LNALQKKKDKYVDRSFFEQSIKDITVLHFARSTSQFDALGQIMLSDWRKKLEGQLADWFEREYLTAPYNRWSVTASGVPGADSQQQAIESSHRDAKRDCYGSGGECCDAYIIMYYSTVDVRVIIICA
jgi:hypothetical protein